LLLTVSECLELAATVACNQTFRRAYLLIDDGVGIALLVRVGERVVKLDEVAVLVAPCLWRAVVSPPTGARGSATLSVGADGAVATVVESEQKVGTYLLVDEAACGILHLHYG